MNNNNNNLNFSWIQLCSNLDKIKNETNILINRSKEARNIIMNLNSTKKIIGILSDDTFEFNSFHSLSKLLRIVCPNSEVRRFWDYTDNILNDYITEFNCDENLFNKLSQLPTADLDTEDKLFLSNILKSFGKYGLTSKNKNKNKINQVQTILKKICDCEKNIIAYIQQDQPYHKEIYNLVNLRGKYAKLLNYDNYCQLKSDVDANDLKTTLKNLIANSNDSCHDELVTICKQLKRNKVSTKDILDFKAKCNNEFTVSICNSIEIMFSLIHDIFDLKFALLENTQTWHPSVKIYSIKYCNEIYGYIYIDLLARQDKVPYSILPIIINEALIYPHDCGVFKIPVMCLVGYLKNNITYIDVINIFKALGQIVHTVFHRSKYEINIEQNVVTLMPQLFEYLISDVDIIKKIFGKKYEKVYNASIIDRTFKLKYKCVNTLYDYLVHSINQVENVPFIYEKYDEILKMVLGKSYDRFIVINECLPVDTVVELVHNGGVCYSDITNNIMAYNLYSILKDKNLFHKFSNDILRNTSQSFGVVVSQFIINEQKNKLPTVNKYKSAKNEPENIVSENTNYFTENEN